MMRDRDDFHNQHHRKYHHHHPHLQWSFLMTKWIQVIMSLNNQVIVKKPPPRQSKDRQSPSKILLNEEPPNEITFSCPKENSFSERRYMSVERSIYTSKREFVSFLMELAIGSLLR